VTHQNRSSRADAAAPSPSTQHNRGTLDTTIDQMMGKHGIQFSEAYALDATALRGMPQVTIQPTLEYDAKRHTLQGPLLSTVLAACCRCAR